MRLALIVLALSLAAPTRLPAESALRPSITAVWANEGGDKVAREELRVGKPNGRAVTNSCWDGTKITIFGARNEVVNFNLVLEAAGQTASNVTVKFDTLTGPGGAVIQSVPATGNGVFSWVGRPIELFYVRYLQIKGLSRGAYENYYDERHVPERLRRPWTGDGKANPGTKWASRPDHDQYYPDIAVPLELVPTFNIGGGSNQSVWADIYIPKQVPAGLYTGLLTVAEGGGVTRSVPVELTVLGFALPDMPTARTMLDYSAENVNERYLGRSWVSGADEARAKLIQDRHFLLAHRHKISLIGDESNIESDQTTADRPGSNFIARLQGTFFTPTNGYDGPGVNVGNNVYAVHTYGIPASWKNQKAMTSHANAWVNWFEANSPQTEYFLYLIDESSDYEQTETWAQWLSQNPGPGNRLKSMATIALPDAVGHTPTLQVVASVAGFGVPGDWEGAANQYAHDPVRRLYLYNGSRPAGGTFATEDDGVALRVNAWIQFKKHINRWFYWESTYYNNFQGNSGKQNLFQSAYTFGNRASNDDVQGQTGKNYCNGDGVLLYPGTDKLFAADSYNVDGPFASLRMKQWRRGLQDHDYLTLASQVDPVAVSNLVARIIPKVVWEVGVDATNDPTYVHANISWPIYPDIWEAARAQLAQILTNTDRAGIPNWQKIAGFSNPNAVKVGLGQ